MKDLKRITLLCGHYGSGKTNIAVNIALKLREKFDKIAVADLDIVNSLFGTNIHAIMNPEFELRSAEEEDNSNEDVQMNSEMVGTGDSDSESSESGAEGNSKEGDTGTDDENKQEDNDSDENSDSDKKGDEEE